MNDLSVTIAMPTYNAIHIVQECLAALEVQDYPRSKMQIVVGDNGSTDGTVELIKQDFPSVEIVQAVERGSGYARNAAFAAAKGQYICSIDADCVADPGWVSAMVNAFESSPESVASLGGQILPYRTATTIERYRPAWIQQETLRDGKQPIVYAETPNAAYRRSALETVGYFDGTQGMDDTDLGMRLTAAGFEIHYAPEAIVRHRNPATLSELYRHRMKYGVFMTRLARKYPEQFGDPDSPVALRRLAYQTARRVVGDLAYKLPRSVVLQDNTNGLPIGPALDAVVAVANYVGVRRAYRENQ